MSEPSWNESIQRAQVEMKAPQVRRFYAKADVGETDGGGSLAYRVSPSLVQPIPFAVPRSHARAVRLPMGQVAVVGGSTWVESFTP